MQGDKFVDKIRYKDVQSDKKRGFLTSDFSKRDEFSNTIRTEQYREQLKVRTRVPYCWVGHGYMDRGKSSGENTCGNITLKSIVAVLKCFDWIKIPK